MISKNNDKRHWEKLNTDYSKSWNTRASQMMSQREMDFINIYLHKIKPVNILDIGIGTGRVLKSLIDISPINTSIYGIDYIDKMVNYCKKKFSGSSKIKILEVCDISEEPLSIGKSFDFITAIRVLQYSRNWKDILKKIYSKLDPEGLLIFSLPNYDSINRFVNSYVSDDKIPVNSTCLDVGCNTGNLGQVLIKNKNCLVDGIDFDSSVLKSAKKNGYSKTLLLNLNNDLSGVNLLRKKYQVIIFADILEHLIYPVKILLHFKKYLTPNGYIIISLPNIAFLLYRIQLLLGNWNYREYGTLDNTHLKFFTIKSGTKMVEAAGLRIIELIPYNQFGILRYIKPLEIIFPSLFAYQFMIIAKLE